MLVPSSCTVSQLSCMSNDWFYYLWITSLLKVVSSPTLLYPDVPYIPPFFYSTIHNNNILLNIEIITNGWIDSIAPPYSLVKRSLHAFPFVWVNVSLALTCSPSEYLQVFVTSWLRFCIYSEFSDEFVAYVGRVSDEITFLVFSLFFLCILFFLFCLYSFISSIVTTSLIFIKADNNIEDFLLVYRLIDGLLFFNIRIICF